MASFNDGDGVWRTISGRRVFIRNGQSISNAMKASGKFKSGVNNKKKISSEKYNKKLDTEYNNLKNGKINTEEYLKTTDKIMDKYTTDKIERGKLERTKAKVITKQESKAGENEKSTRNKTKMQEMAVKGAPEKDLKEQYKQSLNEVSKMEYDGKINKEEYEKAVKNINDNYINKRNEYNGINTKAGGNNNEYQKYVKETLKNEKYLEANTPEGAKTSKMIREAGVKTFADEIRERESKAGGNEKSASDIMNEKIRSKREFTGYQAYLRDRYGTENEDIVSAGYKNKKDLYQEYKDEVIRRINKKRMEKGTTSLEQAYRKAFQEYKKEHPNTKMNLQRFIKMSEE